MTKKEIAKKLKRFDQQPGSKKPLIMILGLIALSTFLAALVNHINPLADKILDSGIRTNLLTKKKQFYNSPETKDFKLTTSTLYSELVYDYEIPRDFSGNLPWTDLVIANPSRTFSFTWRLKLPFNASFSINLNDKDNHDYSFKLIDRYGLPLYRKTTQFTLPDERIDLSPGIYVFKVSSNRRLDFFKLNFIPRGGETALSEAEDTIKTIHLELDNIALRELMRIVTVAKSTEYNTMVKMPKGRVKGVIVEEDANVDVGLSGRTAEHLSWFPSVDIKVKKGKSFYGIPSFKLYRLHTKSGLTDFIYLSILKDMGLFGFRQDVVDLYVNNKRMGLYFLMETSSAATFEKQERNEGNIVGLNGDRFFFNYPFGTILKSKYFHKLKDSPVKREDIKFFLSNDLNKRINRYSMSKYISFAAVYLTGHGLGVDDLRFYEDPVTNLYEPIPRDLNPGMSSLPKSYRNFLCHAPWSINFPQYTTYPIIIIHSDTTTYQTSSKGITDFHFSIITFLQNPENLSLANRYLLYFHNNRALKEKVTNRLINSLTVACERDITGKGLKKTLKNLYKKYKNDLKKEDTLNFLENQLLYTKTQGVFFVGDSIDLNRQLSPSLPYFSDGVDTYEWNLRTSLSLDRDLLPSFIAPLADGLSAKEYNNKLVLSFLCEKKIFSILERNRFTIARKTFKKVKVDGNSTNILALNPDTGGGVDKTAHNSDGERPDNTVILLGAYPENNNNVVLLFLVRNAVEGVSDYEISFRDNMSSYRPVVNETFHLANKPGRETVTVEQITKNHFAAGEKLRLLAYRIRLSDKPMFYKMSVPENAHMYFAELMYLQTTSSGNTVDGSSSGSLPSGFVKAENGFHLYNNTQVNIKGELVIPEGDNLYIHQGVTLRMSAGSSIKVTGDLYISGTQEEPVKFLSENSQPWAGLYVAGSREKKATVLIKNVVFDNFGKFPKTPIGNIFVNGGLSFYHVIANIENTTVDNAHSEDGMNFISSTINVNDLKISGSYSDAIDLDFVYALIDGLEITESGGDGLDVSNSLIRCRNSRFEKIKDKGISIGEMSKVFVENTSFLNNNMGIANKDQSSLQVSNSHFENNTLAIAQFIKKPHFGKPSSLITNNSYKNNKENYKWLGFYFY